MKENKLEIISGVVLALAIIVLCIALFGKGKADTPAVLLPSTGTTSTDNSSFVTVTPQTVQTVISTLSRPSTYSQTLTIQDCWDDGSSSSTSTMQVRVSDGNTRIISDNGTTIKNILTTSEGLWIWYDGQSGSYYSPSYNSSDTDEWMRIATYEELMQLPKSEITDAGYGKYSGDACLWAEYISPVTGYRTVEYVSVYTGVLMGMECYDGDTLVYKVSSGAISTAPIDSSVFTPPES